MSSNQLKQLIPLDAFKNLKQLNVSFNKLTSLVGVEKCLLLESLDAAHNQITAIEGLQNLTKLSKFMIQNNVIAKITDLSTIKFNTGLLEFAVRGNPFTFTKNYKFALLQLLPQLMILDNQKITYCLVIALFSQ